MGDRKVKDHRSSYQEPHEGLTSEELDNGAERPDTSDARDAAGSKNFEDTPQGREGTKEHKAGAANQNG